LAVSAATAMDLEGLLQRPAGSVPWCHSGPDRIFQATFADPDSAKLWPPLQKRAGLTPPYVLLPATSRPGSYKNPELLASALAEPGLQQIQLVLSGLAAETHRATLLKQFPHLQGRCLVAGFTDLELALAYRHALAVVLPSRIEGFGLPAIEALASGATVLVADARGLREAGAGACPRVSVSDPADLAAWLRLLLDGPSRAWLGPHLQRRAQQRLQQLHPDLLGVALLALARQCSGGAAN
jgi:glycosyltransferase involved in cell wall biosynthesis